MAKASDNQTGTKPPSGVQEGVHRVAVIGLGNPPAATVSAYLAASAAPIQAPVDRRGGLPYETASPVPVAPSAYCVAPETGHSWWDQSRWERLESRLREARHVGASSRSPDSLFVAIAGERYPVKSLQEASDTFRGTLWPFLKTPAILDASERVLGHIAFDGKVYPGLVHVPGDKPLFDPYVVPCETAFARIWPSYAPRSPVPGLPAAGCHPGRRAYPRMPLRAPCEACATCAVSTCRSAPSAPPADAPSWHWRPSDPNTRPGGVLCQ